MMHRRKSGLWCAKTPNKLPETKTVLWDISGQPLQKKGAKPQTSARFSAFSRDLLDREEISIDQEY
jgi:hypothetical protein